METSTMNADPQRLNLTNLPADKPRTTTKAPVRKRGKNDSRLPPLDWAATHGPITGALSATTGAAAVAFLGTATGMPTGLPLLVGAAGVIGHGIGHAVVRRLTARTAVTRAASWLLAGGWTTWAMAEGPLSWKCLGALAGAGVAIGAMASNAAAHEEAAEHERLTEQARALAVEMDSRRRAIANEWMDRIQRIAGVDVAIFAVEFWDNGAGFSLGGELHGATWDRVAGRARNMASDARLPRGCIVHVEEGDIQGRVVLDITTVNVMAKEVLYPTDYSPLSILTGIPWGLQPSSTPAIVMLREACALVLGPPGSGKSTFLDAVLAGFARCPDVITWVIDLKAGAIGRPWARPWMEAQGHKDPSTGTPRPPKDTAPGVDWIASTPAEALLMMRFVIDVNAARQDGYQDLMDAKNTTLLPVSRDIPQIQIVIDEGAELLSARTFGDPIMKELQAKVKKAMRTTRAMAERLVLTAIDGNVSAIGNTEVRKFAPVGVALTSGENVTSNVSKLFSRVKVDTSQLNEKGAGVIGQAGADGFAPTEFKGWKTSPNMVRECILATNHLRAELDDISTAADIDDIYAQRWSAERAGWLWGAAEYREPDVNFGDDDEDDDSGKTTTSRPAAPRRDTPRRSDSAGDGLNLSYKRQRPQDPLPVSEADQLADQFMQQIDAKYGTTTEPTSGLNLSHNRPADADPAIDARRALVRNLIRQAGPDGIDTADIWTALTDTFGQGWNRAVVTTWITDDVRAGHMHRPRAGRIVWGPKPTDQPEGDA